MIEITSPKWQKNLFVLGFFGVIILLMIGVTYDDSVIIDGHRYEHGSSRDQVEKYWHSPNCECLK